MSEVEELRTEIGELKRAMVTLAEAVGKGKEPRTFTRSELAGMTPADFAENRDAILAAQSAGKIVDDVAGRGVAKSIAISTL